MKEEPTSRQVNPPEICDLFMEASRFQAWLDVEAALAQAQAELGVIPQAAADEITRKANLERLDIDAIHEGLAVTGHPLVPLIWELDRICDGDSGGYAHWGATTQNITQTGDILQLRKAHHIFLGQLATLLYILADLAETSKDMLLPGRTHGQHAVPATYGYKVSVWIDELCRHVERLQGCETRVFVAMLGGGAGTLGSLGETGLPTQDKMGERLGLNAMTNPSRASGDHLAEYVTLLGMLAATCSKMGHEVYEQMKQEFSEVEEPVPPGAVGSSTMPQKRNPKLAQNIMASAAEIRNLVPLALEAMQTDHEANGAHEVMMSRAVQESCVLIGDILTRLITLFSGIELFPGRMRRNLDLSGGLIMSEALMLDLGHSIGRQRAHDAVYDAAQATVTEGGTFRDHLAAHPEVRSRLSAERIEALLDPAQYTGMCVPFSERAAVSAREMARAIEQRQNKA